MTEQSNEPTDDLFKHLAAADPVAGQQLPSADDPSAQQILENAMSDNHMNNHMNNRDSNNQQDGQRNLSPIASAGDENPYAWPLTDASATSPSTVAGVSGTTKVTSRSRRNPLMLLSAAAAVLLLVGGLLVFSPDNTPSAVAAVHSAAAVTADADTARVNTTFELQGRDLQGDDGAEDMSIVGNFEAAYAGNDVAFSLTIDEQIGGDFDEEIPISEARLVDDVIYANIEGDWIALDTEGFLGDMVSDFVDPRTVLETVQELTETEEVGSATIDGVETTHYQSIVDLGEDSLEKSGWLGFDGLDVDTDGEVTVDLYVGSDGVLRQLDLAGDVQDTTGTGETGTFAISTSFTDIGSDITVEAPADAEIIDPLQGLFSEE